MGSHNNKTPSNEQSSKYAHPPLTDILLMVIFTLSLKAWVLIIMWFIMAPVAHRWDLGPLYVCFLSSFLFIFYFCGGGVPNWSKHNAIQGIVFMHNYCDPY